MMTMIICVVQLLSHFLLHLKMAYNGEKKGPIEWIRNIIKKATSRNDHGAPVMHRVKGEMETTEQHNVRRIICQYLQNKHPASTYRKKELKKQHDGDEVKRRTGKPRAMFQYYVGRKSAAKSLPWVSPDPPVAALERDDDNDDDGHAPTAIVSSVSATVNRPADPHGRLWAPDTCIVRPNSYVGTYVGGGVHTYVGGGLYTHGGSTTYAGGGAVTYAGGGSFTPFLAGDGRAGANNLDAPLPVYRPETGHVCSRYNAWVAVSAADCALCDGRPHLLASAATPAATPALFAAPHPMPPPPPPPPPLPVPPSRSMETSLGPLRVPASALVSFFEGGYHAPPPPLPSFGDAPASTAAAATATAAAMLSDGKLSDLMPHDSANGMLSPPPTNAFMSPLLTRTPARTPAARPWRSPGGVYGIQSPLLVPAASSARPVPSTPLVSVLTDH